MNRVVFDQHGSYIGNNRGERLKLREKDGVYVLDCMVAPPNWKPEDDWNSNFSTGQYALVYGIVLWF